MPSTRPNRKPPALAHVALAALALTAACGPGRGPDGDPDAPVVLEAADVHAVGTSDALADVRDLEVLPDGTVWVLNSLEPFFLRFGADGGAPRAWGNAGGGPDEFGLPSSFVTGGLDGDVWTLDLRRHTLVRVSRPDEPRAEVALPRASIPPGSVVTGMDLLTNVVRLASWDGDVVVPRTGSSLRAGIYAFRLAMLRADLLALDPSTDSVRTIVSLADAIDDPAAGFEPAQGGFPLWFRLWAVCGDELRVYDRTRNQLRGYSASGAEGAAVPLPPVAFTEATPRQFARAIFALSAAERAGEVGTRPTPEDSLRILNGILESIDATPAELGAYLPRYVDFRCSEDGVLWMKPFDPDEGALRGTRRWWRIAPDGATREVLMPPSFDPYRFTPERIWGVQRDELDRATVAWVEAPR